MSDRAEDFPPALTDDFRYGGGGVSEALLSDGRATAAVTKPVETDDISSENAAFREAGRNTPTASTRLLLASSSLSAKSEKLQDAV